VNVTCDKCGRVTVEEDSKTVEIVIDGEAIEIDLCVAACLRNLAKGYIDMGRPVVRSSTAKKKSMGRELDDAGNVILRKCLGPGCSFTSETKMGLAQHLMQTHGFSGANVVERVESGALIFDPTYVPKAWARGGGRQRAPQERGEFPCDQPGCKHISPTNAGLGSHKAFTHKIAGAKHSKGSARAAG